MMTAKHELEQKLAEVEKQFTVAKHEKEKTALLEQAYWLERALDSGEPDTVLERAFAFWKKTGGKIGVTPFVIEDTPAKTPKLDPILPKKPQNTEAITMSSGSAHAGRFVIQPGDTLWGILYQAFVNGDGLDDPHFSDLFNRLPPAVQTHFVDAAEIRVRSFLENEMRVKTSKGYKKNTAYNITDANNLRAGETINLSPLLTDEEELLHIVVKTREITGVHEEHTEQNSRKISDWLRYHHAEPRTEANFEEVLFGMEAEKAFTAGILDEEVIQYIKKAENGENLPPQDEETVVEALPLYERKIRDRLTMTTSEYLRIRHVSIEDLLHAVPADTKQLALIAKSAVRQELLEVPDAEFQKRARTAKIIRAYAFGAELRNISVRQFFRGIVEES